MAKASSGALSTFVTTDEGRERVQAYRDAQENLRQALDARENQLFDPTLLAISQALGSPTKTGSFGEVLGNVAGAIGTSQQAEDKRAREAAAMRLELAQQGLQSYQATQGDKIFNEVLARGRGQPPAGQPAASSAGQPAAPTEGQPAQPGVASSQPPAETSGGLKSITTDDIAMVGRTPNGMAKAEFLLKLQDSERGRFKTLDGQIIDLDAQGGPALFADFRNVKQEPTEIVVRGEPLNLNMTPTELREFNTAFRQGKGDEYFDKNLKGRRTDVNLPPSGGDLKEISVPLLGDVVFRGTQRQAAMVERLSEQALKTRNPTALKEYVDSITNPMPMPAAPAAQAAPPAAQAAPGQPAAPAVTGRPPQAAAPQPTQQPATQTDTKPPSDLSGLPLAQQEKIIIDRLALANKPAEESIATLQKAAGPETIMTSDRRLGELINIVTNHPKVVGLMNKEGVFAGMAAAAQQGLQVGSTSVSLPVTAFLEKAKLNPQEQQIARRAAQLMAEEFFSRAPLSKSVVGPQISNADIVLQRSQMATMEDGPALIRYWSLHGRLVNKQNDELVSAYNTWLTNTKGRQGARMFWDKEGRAVMRKYNSYFENLEKDFSPTRSR